jgi:hypothetical protein
MELVRSIAVRWAVLTFLLLATGAPATADGPARVNKELSLLFVGNSFTHRGGMPKVVAELTEAGNPELRLKHLAFGGSGASIQRHWKGRTALGLITLASLTKEERDKTLKSFRGSLAKDPDDAMAKNGLRIYRILLRQFRPDADYWKWDFVALQKYEATDGYMEYAEKFAAEIKARGGRPILYLTATGKGAMNAKPLAEPPGPDVVWNDAKVFAEFADRIGAAVAPMPAVALHCNRVRPDLTLRWVNDAHPNQTMAYLTACTFYAAMFNRSPEGLPVDKATDIKTFGKEGKDADGGPLTRTFSPKDRADLQRIAWEAYSEFQKLRKSSKAEKHDSEQAATKRFNKLVNGAWKEALNDPGTGKWQDKWFLDGAKAKVTNSPKGMTLTAGPKAWDDSCHAVLWTKQSFKGDLKIEYEYTKTDSTIRNVTILYIQATGCGRERPKDISRWTRNIPSMSSYFNRMNLYHISYAAFGQRNDDPKADYIRARRYMPEADKGLAGTSLKSEYSQTGLFKTGVPYRITVIKKGKELFMHIKGDKQEKLCHFTADEFPAVTEGRIGLRHMYTRGARYHDFRVSVPAQP